MFREICVCPEVHIVVGMKNPDGPVDLESHHHQLHQMRRHRSWKFDAVILLDESCPSQPDIGMAKMRFTVDLAALLDCRCNDIFHDLIADDCPCSSRPVDLDSLDPLELGQLTDHV